jgi:hypothetical protein
VVLCRLRHGRGLFGLFLLGLLLFRLLLSGFFGFGLFLPEQTTEEGVKILSRDLRQSLVLRGSLEDQPASDTRGPCLPNDQLKHIYYYINYL